MDVVLLLLLFFTVVIVEVFVVVINIWSESEYSVHFLAYELDSKDVYDDCWFKVVGMSKGIKCGCDTQTVDWILCFMSKPPFNTLSISKQLTEYR